MALARIRISTFLLRVILPVCAVLICVLPAAAQTVGDCETGNAEAILDVGNVRAKILNTGALFWNGGMPVYEVPLGGGVKPIFAASLMIGGLVDGEVRAAATRYGPYEMWPGPIPGDGSAPTDCERFDELYRARGIRGDRLEPIGGISVGANGWPVELGAPFIDVGGTPETYDPDDGDYPAMLGDEMLWWVMNDRGNEHKSADSKPLGIEVRGSAFAFRDVGYIGEYTFVRYRIANRSDQSIRGMYVGLYTDWDLGVAFDDYVGSDSSLGLAYAYNADDFDDGNYGEHPPAAGLTALRRPESTIDPMSDECRYEDGKSQGVTNHLRGGILRDANTAAEVYNRLQSRLPDGEHLKVGGFESWHDGPLGPETNYVYPGDPFARDWWSEMNTDREGTTSYPSDRRSHASVGPFCLGPGDEADVVFAYVWARGDSNLDSVRLLRRDTANLHESADVLLEPRRFEHDTEEPPASSIDFYAASIYPNPAPEEATFRLGLPRDTDVRIEVYDIRGRRVEQVADGRLSAGLRAWTLQTSNWPPGVYLVRLQLDHLTETRRLVVVR